MKVPLELGRRTGFPCNDGALYTGRRHSIASRGIFRTVGFRFTPPLAPTVLPDHNGHHHTAGQQNREDDPNDSSHAVETAPGTPRSRVGWMNGGCRADPGTQPEYGNPIQVVRARGRVALSGEAEFRHCRGCTLWINPHKKRTAGWHFGRTPLLLRLFDGCRSCPFP